YLGNGRRCGGVASVKIDITTDLSPPPVPVVFAAYSTFRTKSPRPDATEIPQCSRLPAHRRSAILLAEPRRGLTPPHLDSKRSPLLHRKTHARHQATRVHHASGQRDGMAPCGARAAIDRPLAADRSFDVRRRAPKRGHGGAPGIRMDRGSLR